MTLSVIIPALNEAAGIVDTIRRIQAVALTNSWQVEILVVDDGSSDDTGRLARAAGATVLRHPARGGYGLSLQHGIRVAQSDIVAITDADGTYPIEQLPALFDMVAREGYDMAVGARQGTEYTRGVLKYPARLAFRWLAEYVAGRRIPDVNSGLRVMRRARLLPHLERTCMGFSFTTSITLIFFLSGYFVGYRPIEYAKRLGATKVRHVHDTLRTAQIMFSVIAYYNPLKLFLLLATMSLLAALVCGMFFSIFAWPAFFWLGIGLVIDAPVLFGLGCVAELIRLGYVGGE